MQTPAGTDINKVGIKPDVQLQAQPPLEPAGFCQYAGPNEVCPKCDVTCVAQPWIFAQMPGVSTR